MTRRRRIRPMPRPMLLGRHRDDGLCFGFPAPLSLFGAADIGLRSTSTAPVRLCRPGRQCGIYEHPLQTQGAELVTNHMNHMRSGLRVPSKSRTSAPAYSSPRRHPRLSSPSAVWASKPVRPTQPNIVPASGVAPEPLIHLLKRPRIINPGDGASAAIAHKICRAVHPTRLSFPPTGVKGIPSWRKINLLPIHRSKKQCLGRART